MVYAGIKPAERRARALASLERVGLAERAGHTPAELSGGQQQRVAIARALVNAPQLIRADEPTGALDSKTSQDIMRLLAELNAQGMTVILVTHEIDIAAFARRRITFKDGRVIEDVLQAAAGRRASHERAGRGAPRVAGAGDEILLRSILTMLGIIIGVAAVITMLAIGTGAQQRVAEQMKSLGSNLILVMPGAITQGGVRLGAQSGQSLTEDDARAIAAEIPEVQAVAPSLRTALQIVAGNTNWSSSIYGTTNDYFETRDWPLAEGRMFEAAEMSGAGKVAILGRTVAEQLFGDADLIDQTIRVKTVPLTVIGVLEAKRPELVGPGSGRRRGRSDLDLRKRSRAPAGACCGSARRP
jgi:energy-coupling factor transporter ATP-binding protein EcfA2